MGNGQTDAHACDIVTDIYHNGRERLFIIRLGLPKNLEVIMATCERLFLFYLFGKCFIKRKRFMDSKKLGERLRMIRKHFGINQQQLAKATNLTQPAISRLENGEEVYASSLLAVLSFYHDKVDLDHLFTNDLNDENNNLLYCSRHGIKQKLENQLCIIAHDLSKSQAKLEALRSKL